MGGMAAVIPSRTDEEANRKAFEAVSEDKEREARAASTARGSRTPTRCRWLPRRSTRVLGDRPNQVDRQRDDVRRPPTRCSVAPTPGERTEEGLRSNVNVGIQYISSWLRGNGAAGIYGLMEDAATAEISRAPGVAVGPPRRARRRPTRNTRAGARAGDLGAGEDPRGDRRRRLVRGGGPPRPVALAVRARGAERRLRGVPDAAGLRRAAEAREAGRRRFRRLAAPG